MKYLIGLLLSLVTIQSNAQVQAEASRALDATHFEFSGQKSWKYDVRKDSDDGAKVIATLPPLSTAAIDYLKGYKDAFIKGIKINPNGVDGQSEVEFLLSDSKVEFFNYETENPAKVIIDFYSKNKEKTAVLGTSASDATSTPIDDKAKKDENAEKAEKIAKKATALPKIKIRSGGVVHETDLRSPASTEFIQVESQPGDERIQPRGVFDGADPLYKRFVLADYELRPDAIIASRNRLYMNFPLLWPESPELKALIENAPQYEITPQENEENKTARLLLTLFKNKRVAVFLSTAKFFEEHYPQSPYLEMIKYMTADIHYRFWQEQKNGNDFETAMGIYRMLVEKYPKGPLVKRTLFLMAFSYVERGDSFNALKIFKRIDRTYRDAGLQDAIRIAMADAYKNVHQSEEAIKVLEDLEKNAKDRAFSADAAFRLGDIYAKVGNYKAAIDSYLRAIKNYPENWASHPGGFFNLAESRFRLAHQQESIPEYKNCLESLRDFLIRFPSHPHGAFALTRIGEVIEILAGQNKKSLGAYFESNFRFKNTPGGSVAKMRILEDRMATMKEKEFKDAIREVEEYRKTLQIDGIKDFTTILVVDGNLSRKKYEVAIEKLVKFFQENPDSPLKTMVTDRIVKSITEQIHDELIAGNNLEALRVYTRYQNTWLKDVSRMDLRYYVGKAYESVGGLSEAENIYRDTLNSVYAIKGTSKELERNVFEKVPEVDSLNLRMARVAELKSDYLTASTYLEKIPKQARLDDAEQIERAQISANVFTARGQPDRAISYLKELADTWRGKPQLLAPIYLRLAKLYQDQKQNDKAIAQLDKNLAFYKDSQSVSIETYAESLLAKADIVLSEKRRAEAVGLFKEYLELNVSDKNLGSVRYRAGKAAFDSGDLKTAEALWGSLDSTKDSVWQQLAQEQMQGAKWKKEYKKYVNRIPAMEDGGSSSESK